MSALLSALKENIGRLSLCLVIIAAAVVVYFALKLYIDHLSDRTTHRKRLTFLRLSVSIVKYLCVIFAAMMVLQVFGIDTASTIAGLGVISIIAGLALQDALKDVIMGFNLITDNYFEVGDVVEVNGITGIVLEIGLKVTRLKNIRTGSIEVIANRNISSSSILSHQLDIDVPLPYDLPYSDIESCMNDILAELQNSPEIESGSFIGIQEFADSSVNCRLRLMVNPENRLQCARDARSTIKQLLDARGISIPFNQLDVHMQSK